MDRFVKFTDYRDFIKDYLDQRKLVSPRYSCRKMARDLFMDPSHLRRVLLKKQHLLPKSLPLVKAMLNLEGRYSKCFDLMYAAALSSDASERNHLLSMAFALHDVEQKPLTSAELKVLYNWWTPVIRSLLEVSGGICDERYLSHLIKPKVQAYDIRESLNALLSTGQIKKISSGKCALVDSHIVVAKNLEKYRNIVHEYQKKIFNLVSEMIEVVPAEKRHVSTMVLGVDEECFKDLQDMFVEFKKSIQKRVDEVRFPTRVMQMAFALFPVAEKEI